MFPESLIEQMGGGLPAVVIAALATAVVVLWRDNKRESRERIQDMIDANKSHADLSREMSRALDDMAEAMRSERRS